MFRSSEHQHLILTSGFLNGIFKRSKGFSTNDTVDGQNPAPPRMMIIPVSIGF